jgi:hypothetical protein
MKVVSKEELPTDETPIYKLPRDILLSIASCTPSARDLSNLGATCRYLNNVFQDPSIWKEYVTDYGFQKPPTTTDDFNWKGYFFVRARIETAKE